MMLASLMHVIEVVISIRSSNNPMTFMPCYRDYICTLHDPALAMLRPLLVTNTPKIRRTSRSYSMKKIEQIWKYLNV